MTADDSMVVVANWERLSISAKGRENHLTVVSCKQLVCLCAISSEPSYYKVVASFLRQSVAIVLLPIGIAIASNSLIATLSAAVIVFISLARHS